MKILRKILLIFIIIIILVNLLGVPVYAETMKVYYDTEELVFKPLKLNIEGVPFISDAPITLINSRAYAPVKAVFEHMGATVRWYGNENKVSITKDDIKIVLTINSKIAVVNNQNIEMDAEAKVMRYEGLYRYYTMVPARFVAEQLGMEVGYIGSSRTVTFDTHTPTSSSKINIGNSIEISSGNSEENIFIKPHGQIKFASSAKLGVITLEGIELTDKKLNIGFYKENFIRGTSLELLFSGEFLLLADGIQALNNKFIKNIITKIDTTTNVQSILIEFSMDVSYGILSKEGDGKTVFYFNESSNLSSRIGSVDSDEFFKYSIAKEYEEIEININDISDYILINSSDPNKKIIGFKNNSSILNPEEILLDSRRIKTINYSRYDDNYIWFVFDIRSNIELKVLKINNKYLVRISDVSGSGIKEVEEEVNIIDTPKNENTGAKFNNTIGKNIFYSNLNDRVYFKIDDATLTEGGEYLDKLYTGLYENNSKKYTIEFASHLAKLDSGKIVINDMYLESIEIQNNSSSGKTKIIFIAKDKFIYCVFTRYNTNAEDIATGITLLKPANSGEKLVVIDPGHGGGEPGKPIGNIYEKDINLAIAINLKKELVKNNIRTYVLREDDSFIGLYERTYIANYLNASLFISIHNNAADRETVNGTEIFYFSNSNTGSGLTGKKVAEYIQSSLVSELNSTDRGIKSNTNLAVLKGTQMPAVLAEIGFMTNPAELSKLISQEYQNKITKAILEGIKKSILLMD